MDAFSWDKKDLFQSAFDENEKYKVVRTLQLQKTRGKIVKNKGQRWHPTADKDWPYVHLIEDLRGSLPHEAQKLLFPLLTPCGGSFILAQFTKSIQIYHDPDPLNTVVEADKQWLSLHWEIWADHEETMSKIDRSSSPWILRIELDKGPFLIMWADWGLTMEGLAAKITEMLGDNVYVTHSIDSCQKDVLALRIRLLYDDDDDEKLLYDDDDEEEFQRQLKFVILSEIDLAGGMFAK